MCPTLQNVGFILSELMKFTNGINDESDYDEDIIQIIISHLNNYHHYQAYVSISMDYSNKIG